MSFRLSSGTLDTMAGVFAPPAQRQGVAPAAAAGGAPVAADPIPAHCRVKLTLKP